MTDAAPTHRELIDAIPILKVENLAASLEYYVESLGFRQHWSTGDFASLVRDGVTLFLCEGRQGQPGTWIWIGVKDLDRWFAMCRLKGAKFKRGITNFEWGAEFWVVDPDGHVLRFGADSEEHEHGPDNHHH